MATTADLLLDSLERVRETAHWVLDDTPEPTLATPPAPGANTVAWLVWHLTRVLDEQVADALGYDPVWEAGGWRERFALPFPPDAHGYGMTFDEVLRVQASPEHLGGYLDAAWQAATDCPAHRERQRPRPRRRRQLGPAGHPRRAPRQRRQRLHPARRPGVVRERHPQPRVSSSPIAPATASGAS